MIAVTYQMTLREPVLATTLDGEPNSAVSADYLPGSALRGLLAGEYLRRRGGGAIESTDPEFRRLFLDGTTRFLNGYPLGPDDQRSLPAPLSWFRPKNGGDLIYDRAIDPETSIEEPKGIDQPFHQVAENSDQVTLIRPRRRVAIHIARGPRGRPTRDDGSVFQYDALAPEQSFGAAILCETREDAVSFAAMLREQLEFQIGRSRSAGYGSVEIPPDRVKIIDDWRETGASAPPDPTETLILTFLSDTILRDENGQPSASPATAVSALQFDLDSDLRLRQAFVGTRIVGGFNRAWGLPLPQSPALMMGSVLVLDWPRGDSTAFRQRLRALEDRGLGERRAEGFGRIVANWSDTKQWTCVDPPAPGEPPRVSRMDERSTRLAQRMIENILQARIEQAIIHRAGALEKSARSAPIPSSAQLGRLRAILRDCLALPPDSARTRLTAYLAHAQARQVSRQRFARSRVDGRPFLEWIERSITNPNTAWDALQISGDLPQIGPVTAKPGPDVIFRTGLRLIDRVCAALMKSPDTEVAEAGAREGRTRA